MVRFAADSRSGQHASNSLYLSPASIRASCAADRHCIWYRTCQRRISYSGACQYQRTKLISVFIQLKVADYKSHCWYQTNESAAASHCPPDCETTQLRVLTIFASPLALNTLAWVHIRDHVQLSLNMASSQLFILHSLLRPFIVDRNRLLQSWSHCAFCSSVHKNKGKAIPLQAWTGPEGSRRLRLPDFKTIDTWRW